MTKPKWNLNTVYISDKLQDSLRPISRCRLTTVVAPMGYGKTTAVNWYLERCSTNDSVRIIRISVYSDNLAILWRSAQDAFVRSGFDFLRDYILPTDAGSSGLVIDDICHALAGADDCYIFIDDFHLITDERASLFLCKLVNKLPENAHIIVAGRDRFLPAGEIVRLGSKVYQIGVEQLRLNRTDLADYSLRCGAQLNDEQLLSLLYSSEGWFSAVYLSLRTLYERGVLPDKNSDIYSMFTAAMIDPLSSRQQRFLSVMGLADEFTAQMARCVTNNPETDDILSMLTEQNAFVKLLPDGVTYRFHHMMKDCAERCFYKLNIEEQKEYLQRFGIWYETHGQFLHAITAYRKSDDYDSLLRVVRKDAGILLASLNPSEVLEILEQCPSGTLKANPFAILVLMRRMFTWRQIPKMLKLKELLLNSIAEHPDMSTQERGNLLGECDLIMSFLCYNDISAMSRLHRSACAQMTRKAISIRNDGGWTFGSPSVLMMFYRAPGELNNELAEMDECMPHYYKITDNHGLGAEKIMHAEASYLQGRFTDSHIELESAYSQIERNGQETMSLCCDFLAYRLSLFADAQPHCALEKRYAVLLENHNSEGINIWYAISAYYYALTAETDKIPEIFSRHRISSLNILAPGKPMIEMIENQVYLAQGAYANVIGRSEELFAMCEDMHYALVALHIRIQTASAYVMLGKSEQACDMISTALNDAQADGFIMPFVENYDYLKQLPLSKIHNKLIARIEELSNTAKHKFKENSRADVFSELTDREYEIAVLISKRLSNREIAQMLFLSEGSVKQYVNRIYSKLHIDGDTRTKRRYVIELFSSNI